MERVQSELQKSSACTQQINNYLTNVYEEYPQEMWQETLHGINDAQRGEMDVCQGLERNESNNITGSAYTLLNFNTSSTPVVLRLGLCLPVACT